MTPTPASDLSVVRRAGRIVAIQTSAALAAVLLLVGLVLAAVYVHTQSTQIADELTRLAISADDAGDPPPGMELAFRDPTGAVSTSDGGKAGIPLLSGPAGFTDVGDHQRDVAQTGLSPAAAGYGRCGRPSCRPPPCLADFWKPARDHREQHTGYGGRRQAHHQAHPVETASQDAPGRPIRLPADP
jgi:hypothetical protein